MMTNEKLIAVLEEYDAAITDVANARQRLRNAETAMKRAVGARVDQYMDGNELVAGLSRTLIANLKSKGE